MFVVVFGLFEMIKKNKKVRTASPSLGLGSASESGQAQWRGSSHF